MAVNQLVITNLLRECESGVATEGCIPVRRDVLKQILDELISLRRQIVGKPPVVDSKVESQLNNLEKWMRKIEADYSMLSKQLENLSSSVDALWAGSSKVEIGMNGGS